MKSGISLFKSKVAKRIFLLFLLCAMFPITIFSFLSFSQVSTQLKEQSMARIQNTAKSYGLILFERFIFLELELDILGSMNLFPKEENSELNQVNPFDNKKGRHLNAVVFVTNTGTVLPLVGKISSLPKALMDIKIDIISSKTHIFFEPDKEMGSRVFLAQKKTGSDGNPGLLVGEANTMKLWGIGYENILPPLTTSSILDHNSKVIAGSFELPSEILHHIRFESDSLESRSQEYSSKGANFFIGYWPMFLRSKFVGPNLIVVLRNKQEDVFAPLSHFKVLFPLVALLSFWVVLLLSIRAIRKSMVPLEKLKEGALRLSLRDFNTRVDVNSGDEFEALANTFNQSAANLGRQFNAMESMAEIDRIVHASLNTKTIVPAALKNMYAFFSCDTISLGLINEKKPDTIRMTTCSAPEYDNFPEEFLTITPEDRNKLSKIVDTYTFEVKNESPSFLPKPTIEKVKHFLIQPLYHNKALSGIICLGHKEKHSYNNDDIAHIQRLANQLSSALSNAYLLEELEILNWGTLEALARTVDAKSKWTAGHSDRVRKVALKIARIMGLDANDIDNLNRAAFLHDIGKIGIPMLILDKPGKLTDEEYEKVKEHPVLGAKIIEPIEAYSDAVPIILQHHEKFDGNGYPYGLSGENITLGARILAVADVYDAVISSRPYRPGWMEEDVIKFITDEAGKHFDPNVVDAFLTATLVH